MKPILINIPAPIFLEMLHFHGLIPEIGRKVMSCATNDLLVILLNPTETPFAEMRKPSVQLCSATFAATVELLRQNLRPLNLVYAQTQVSYLGEELPAWQGFAQDGYTVVECLKWPFYEFSYGKDDLAHARAQLVRARQFLINSIRKQAKDRLKEFIGIIRTPEQISKIESVTLER